MTETEKTKVHTKRLIEASVTDNRKALAKRLRDIMIRHRRQQAGMLIAATCMRLDEAAEVAAWDREFREPCLHALQASCEMLVAWQSDDGFSDFKHFCLSALEIAKDLIGAETAVEMVLAEVNINKLKEQSFRFGRLTDKQGDHLFE